MKKEEKVRIEENKKNLSVKSMYFNRYLLVRYTIALFFFTNVYWLLSLLMSGSSLFFIPLAIILLLLSSTAEQIKMINKHTNQAVYTKYYFITQLIINGVLMILSSFSSIFTQLFPFLINQARSRVLVLSVLAIGILLSGIILYRLHQIKNNEDRHYHRIKQYEEVTHA